MKHSKNRLIVTLLAQIWHKQQIDIVDMNSQVFDSSQLVCRIVSIQLDHMLDIFCRWMTKWQHSKFSCFLMCVFSIILKGNTFTVYKFCATSNYFIGQCLNPQSCDELISGCYNWKLRRISCVEVSTRFSLLTFFSWWNYHWRGGGTVCGSWEKSSFLQASRIELDRIWHEKWK